MYFNNFKNKRYLSYRYLKYSFSYKLLKNRLFKDLSNILNLFESHL